MAATLAQIYNAFASQNLVPQVVGACFIAATAIVNEASGAPDHANRLLWAQQTMKDPLAKGRQMLPYVLTNATIQGELTSAADSDIQFVVNSVLGVPANTAALIV